MRKRPETIRHGNLVRTSRWNGVRSGDAVVVSSTKELRSSWVFVAHVQNEATGDQWVEVRGGRAGEAKGRSFRPELIFPANARRGSRVVGMSLAQAPQLPIG
ncbi:MAG: hypothetical protein HKL86_05915 [Acidimicrobiaceae bacterium]|nr:hypothetical protein [Acidimicrobiaceae bacterium]